MYFFFPSASLPVKLEFRVSGYMPSGRELSDLLQALEISLLWGPASEWLRELDREKEQKRKPELSHAVKSLKESFGSFVDRRYGSLIDEVLVRSLSTHKETGRRSLLPFGLEGLEELAQKRPLVIVAGPQQEIDRQAVRDAIVTSRNIGGEAFCFRDFYDWMGEEVGTSGLLTSAVREGSLSFFFDVSAVIMYIASVLAGCPEVGSIFPHVARTLQQWMGKEPRILPHGQPWFSRTISKFDKVDYSVNADGSFKLSLQRSSGS